MEVESEGVIISITDFLHFSKSPIQSITLAMNILSSAIKLSMSCVLSAALASNEKDSLAASSFSEKLFNLLIQLFQVQRT